LLTWPKNIHYPVTYCALGQVKLQQTRNKGKDG
jgi:hypothetical protein